MNKEQEGITICQLCFFEGKVEAAIGKLNLLFVCYNHSLKAGKEIQVS